ncbi:hypothetical protein [Sorlinia euscelidii]|uniref:hypothetical protein n=1 Tax=Sorlinia euscelidii TaxID=3081148 RepID=UPI00374E163B
MSGGNDKGAPAPCEYNVPGFGFELALRVEAQGTAQTALGRTICLSSAQFCL